LRDHSSHYLGRFADDLHYGFSKWRSICKLRLSREIELKRDKSNVNSAIITKTGEKIHDYG